LSAGRRPCSRIEGRPLLEVVDYAPLRELFVLGKPGISGLPLPDGRIAKVSLVQVVTPFGEPVGLAVILRRHHAAEGSREDEE
jgi:hypothetical protein